MKKLLLHSLLISLSCQAAALNILTAHPITTGIAETLLAEEIAAERIRILPAAPKTLPTTRQLNYLQGRGKDNLKSLSQEADIVLTVRSIFAQDYLYPFSHRHNIRIIPIDLATPIDGERAGVSKQAQDFLQHPVWLDPYNLSLMYSTLAQELQAYDPALQLENALHQEQKRLIALKNDMEAFLNEQEAEPVVSCSTLNSATSRKDCNWAASRQAPTATSQNSSTHKASHSSSAKTKPMKTPPPKQKRQA